MKFLLHYQKTKFKFNQIPSMTLAEVLPAINNLSAIEKLKLIKILAEELDIAEKIAPIEPNYVYNLPTVYDTFGAGEILMNALKESEE